MSTAVSSPSAVPMWIIQRPQWFLVALHLPLLAVSPVLAITGFEGRPAQNPVVVTLLALGIGGLQLRHSLAAARGERPAGWMWTFLALAALVYVPLRELDWNWAAMQWFVVASGATLLRGWFALLATAGPVLGTAIASGSVTATYGTGSVLQIAFWTFWWLAGLSMGGLALYGSARLVRVVDELDAARSELAELAVGQERLRVSRDLHDLLGQSLSAVSLKGDLAIRLVATDASAARTEIESLTEVARSALRDVRAVARDEHAVSLRSEMDAAAALLGAAGIDTRLDVDLPDLAADVEEVLAWAVREGATNMLRHSDARACSITAARRHGAVELEMVNDGVRGPEGEGRGLAGLAERSRELSGSVSAGRTPDGRFRLFVQIPEGAP